MTRARLGSGSCAQKRASTLDRWALNFHILVIHRESHGSPMTQKAGSRLYGHELQGVHALYIPESRSCNAPAGATCTLHVQRIMPAEGLQTWV